MRLAVFFFGLIALGIPSDGRSQASGFSWDLFVDASYAYDFANPEGGDRLFTKPGRHHEPEIGLGMARGRYDGEHVRGVLALTYASYRQESWAAQPTPYDDVLEASVGVRLAKSLWLDGGILPSHIGVESPISALNWTATRTMPGEFAPYREKGVRLSYEPSRLLSASLLFVEGWHANWETTPGRVGGGIRVQLRPADRLFLTYSNYIGTEWLEENNPAATWVLESHDVAVQLGVTDRLSVAAIYDHGLERVGNLRGCPGRGTKSGDTWSWNGGALLARVRIIEKLAVVMRGEYFDDPCEMRSATGVEVGFSAKGGSLGLDYQPFPFAVLKLEGRTFVLPEPFFSASDGEPVARNWVVVGSMAIWVR